MTTNQHILIILEYFETVSIWSLFGPKKSVMRENVGGRGDSLFGREEQGGRRRGGFEGNTEDNTEEVKFEEV